MPILSHSKKSLTLAFIIQASKMVDRMFPQADTDKDDQISFEEFKKWAPHDPKMKAIMRLLGPVG